MTRDDTNCKETVTIDDHGTLSLILHLARDFALTYVLVYNKELLKQASDTKVKFPCVLTPLKKMVATDDQTHGRVLAAKKTGNCTHKCVIYAIRSDTRSGSQENRKPRTQVCYLREL